MRILAKGRKTCSDDQRTRKSEGGEHEKMITIQEAAYASNITERKFSVSERKMASRKSFGRADGRVVINISGKRYVTREKTLSRFPETLLALPIREKFFDRANKEYYFDRNRKAFGSILTYYQTGILAKPNLDDRIFAAELQYFGFTTEAEENEPCKKAEETKILPKNQILKVIWELFEYPETSTAAGMIAYFSMAVILLSIVMFCLETLPYFKYPIYKITAAPNNQTKKEFESFDIKPKFYDLFFITECACIAWFTLEYILRFASSPKKCKFVYQVLNLIDLVSILPFYITELVKAAGADASSLSVLRVLRLVRVFRIFKLSRYSSGLKILGYTFKASLQELGLLAFFLLIGIVLFASAAYYCEEGVANTKFESIPHSFWWAIVTMTTVGYGDMTPETLGGKLVGSFCVLLGVLAIAFPVPVIVNNFTYYYTLELRQPDGLDEEYTESPLGRRRPSSQGSVSPEVAVDKLNGNTPNEKSLMRDDEVFLEHKVNRGNKTFARENSMGNDSLLEDVKVEQGMENWTQVESKV